MQTRQRRNNIENISRNAHIHNNKKKIYSETNIKKKKTARRIILLLNLI